VRRLVASRRVHPEVACALFNPIRGNAASLDSHQPVVGQGGSQLNQRVNTGHTDALVPLAREFAGIQSLAAAMTSVGRLGFQIRVKTQDGTRGARIAFLREVSRPAEARKVLVENGRTSTANVSSGAARQ